ncbi:hypothetical protein [Streptomyces subrutilus]|uniref:Uncharacterized protein n=1 Tax=Streptomyces subrutilus TaxID=36818 RepID=A0A918QPM4_9ACTN|nr:hypothetical protein [Streptomyces subrutilus]WSJ33230.1 hypothetical protein OG479_30220 [Streptomyces subrutilus]GGZ65129.1 hypothetical protein GCM10010371_26040 [Streptomyces subrutilus]
MSTPTPLEAARAAAAAVPDPQPGGWAAHLHAALAEVDRLTGLLARGTEAGAGPAPREARSPVERRRAELETGFADVAWAVGMVLCPAREHCTSGRLDQLFKPLDDGRLPMHWDELSGATCPGAGRQPTTPPLASRPDPA